MALSARGTVLCLLFLAMAGIGAAAVTPTITIESVTPQPASPGETIKMEVTVENEGDSRATFDPVVIETVTGITVIGTTDAIGQRFTLCGGCRQVGTIYLKADPETVSGTYPVEIRLTHGDAGIVKTEEIEVDGTPRLTIDMQEGKTVPGQNVTATMTVKNVGTDTASATTVTLDAAKFGMFPTTVSYGSIAPGETVSRSFQLAADERVGSGLQQATFDLTYRDDSSETTTTRTAALTVLKQADLAVSDFSLDDATVGAVTQLVVQVENLGPGEATNIVSTLTCDGAEVQTEKDFVGQLDDTESVPMTFEVRPTAQAVQCSVTTDYEDRAAQTIDTSFSFTASQSSGPLPYLAGAVIVIIAGYLVWRRRNDEAAAV